MKQLDFYDISVPELGDKPLITQVSDAIEDIGNTVGGAIEAMNMSISGDRVILTSGIRKINRLKYYDGMAFHAIAIRDINIGSISKIQIDNLPVQQLEISIDIKKGSTFEVVYNANKFVASYISIPVVDNLLSTDSTKALSAHQGKLLNDRINARKDVVDATFLNLDTNKLEKGRFVGTAQDLDDKIDGLESTKLNKSGGTVSGDITVTGTVYCNGNITAFSDIRLKENLNIIENPLEKVSKINGYTYNMIGHKERMTGVIAQELEQVLPEAVSETDEGTKSVAYGNVIGLLIEAIKEQNKEIEKLKALVM